MEKRQKIFADTKGVIMGMYNQLQHDYDVMTMTLPEDKKDFVKKEVKAVSEKLEGGSNKITTTNIIFTTFYIIDVFLMFQWSPDSRTKFKKL